MELLERAVELLAHRRHKPSQVEVVAAGLDALLDRSDPLREVQRAERRQESRQQKGPDRHQGDLPRDGQVAGVTCSPDRRQEGRAAGYRCDGDSDRSLSPMAVVRY
jgi:hypothetical protein